jgi:hypothetical protein
VEPAPDEIAGSAPAIDYFVMTASPAEVSRPTGIAWFLPVHVTLREPCILPVAIHAEGDIPESACVVINESMAGVESSLRRDSEVTGPSAARIGTVGAGVNLAQGVNDVSEGIPAPGDHPHFEMPPTFAHLFQHPG